MGNGHVNVHRFDRASCKIIVEFVYVWVLAVHVDFVR